MYGGVDRNIENPQRTKKLPQEIIRNGTFTNRLTYFNTLNH
jgi:hypothetical protein